MARDAPGTTTGAARSFPCPLASSTRRRVTSRRAVTHADVISSAPSRSDEVNTNMSASGFPTDYRNPTPQGRPRSVEGVPGRDGLHREYRLAPQHG